MKLQEVKSDVQIIGEIQSNKVGIDLKNIDHLITILSSNLYSKPISSLIRENVSNAWDSHIEANNTSQPIILDFVETYNKDFFKFRIIDFGTGLSKERFDEIYKNIGSSTKRDSNDFIGNFGIGRFSHLSYTNNIHITSRYNGNKTSYLMYKNGNSISIDTLYEEDTDEPNGLTIEIQAKKSDVREFMYSIYSQLEYFENIVIQSNLEGEYFSNFHKYNSESYYFKDYEDTVKKFNDYKIKSFKSFKSSSLDSFFSSPYHRYRNHKLRILLGRVTYPLKQEFFIDNKYQNLFNYNLVLNFNIGDLEVTPNREEIIYSESTIVKITQKLDELLRELETLCKKQYDNKIFTFRELLSIDFNKLYLDLFEYNGNKVRLQIYNYDFSINLKGKIIDYKLWTFFSSAFNNNYLTKTLDINDNGNFRTKVDTVKMSKCLENEENIMITDYASQLNTYCREYIKSQHNYDKEIIYLKKIEKPFIDGYLKKVEKDIRGWTPNVNDSLLVYLMEQAEDFLINFNNDKTYYTNKSVPKEFIEEIKKRKKEKKEDTNFSYIRYEYDKNSAVLSRRENSHKEIFKSSKTTIICGLEEDKVFLKAFEASLQGIRCHYNKIINHTFISISKTKMQLIEDLDNVINIKAMLKNPNDYPIMKKIGTALYIHKHFRELTDMKTNINMKELNKHLCEVIVKLYNYCDTFGLHKNYYFSRYEEREGLKHFREEILKLCEENNAFDEEIKTLFEENRVELKNSSFLLKFSNCFHQAKPYLIDYIKKNNIFKLDEDVEVKENLFINN